MHYSNNSLIKAIELTQNSTHQDFELHLATNASFDCPTGKCDKTENIIIIGSEMSYNSFWLKLMFAACGYAVAVGKLEPPGWSKADYVSVLIVDDGYTEQELNLFYELTKTKVVNEIQLLKKKDQIITFINKRNKFGNSYKIKNLTIFAHGMTGKFMLDYKGKFDINVDENDIDKISKDIFTKNAILFSSACRTGAGTILEIGVTDPEATESLAQYIANSLKITVKAFYRRTFYGNVMRDKSDSATISQQVKMQRKINTGKALMLSETFEAFPHSGLGVNSWTDTMKGWIGRGLRGEGVHEYALWRIGGAQSLPTYADSPNFPKTFATFKPN